MLELHEQIHDIGHYKLPCSLRHKQIEVIAPLMNKADTFVMLPTSYDKSLCYV